MRSRVSNVLGVIGESGLLLAFWTLGGVVFAQFFFRYFLNMPLGWTEELARYLLILTAFLGLPVVTRRGEHIAIEMLADSLPTNARRWLLAAGELFVVLIVVVLAWQAKALIALSSQTMSSMPLPKSIIYYVVLVGLLLQLVASINRLVELVKPATAKDTQS